MAKTVQVTYTLVDKVTSNLNKISKALDTYESRLKALDKTTSDMSKSDKTNLGKWAKESGEQIKQLGKEVTTFNTAVNGQKRQTLESYNTRIGTMGVKAQTAGNRLNTLTDRVYGLNDVVGKGVDKLGDFAAANEMVGESSRQSAVHMREQASAMRDLNSSVPKLAQAMRTIAKTENDVARAMVLKNKAAKEQSGLLDMVGRKAGFAENRLASNRKEVGRLSRAMKEASETSFFSEGFESGIGMSSAFTKIAGVIPLATLALGGFVAMLNGAMAGVVGMAGSVTSLAGSLAALPGIYAAIGTAAAGAASVMSTIVTPATEGLEKLEGLTDQISSASSAVSSANQNISQARERVANSTTVAGNASARAALEDAYGAQTKAQENLNKIQKEAAEIQKTLPPRAQELVDKIDAVKDSWRAVWFGKNGERAGRIIGSILEGMTAVQNVMKMVEPAAERFAQLMDRASGGMLALSKSAEFAKWFSENLERAQDNFQTIYGIGRNLLPTVAGLATEMNKFTTRVLEAVEGWSEGLDAEKTVGKFSAYLERAYNSLTVWTEAFRNFGGGILTLFSDANGATALFESDLLSMSRRFREWTDEVTASGAAAEYFANSWKVLQALGRVFLSFIGMFGTMGSSAKAADSVVQFLDTLSGGLERLGPYMRDTVTHLGPSMNAFFTALGDFSAGLGAPLLSAVEGIVRGFTKLIEIADGLPGPVKAMLAAMIPLRLAMMAVGFAAGNLMFPFSRLFGIWKSAGVMATFTKGLWGQAAAMGLLGRNAKAAAKYKAAGPMSTYLDPVGGKAKKAGFMGDATRTGAKGVGGSLAAGGGAAALGTTGPAAASGLAAMAAAAGPVLVTIAAVVAILAVLAAGFVAFKTNAEGVADRFRGTVMVIFDNLKEKLDKLSEALGLGKDSFKAIADIGGKIGGVFKSIFKWVGVVVVEAGRFAAIFTGAIVGAMIDNLTLVVDIVKDLYDSFMNIFKADGVGGKFKALGGFILDVLTAPFKGVIGVMRNAVSAMKDVLIGGLYGILDKVPDWLLPDNIEKTIKKYKDAEAKAAEQARQEAAAKSQAKTRTSDAANETRDLANMPMYNIAQGKAPGKGGQPAKKTDASLDKAYNTSEMPGYTQTTAKGAEIRWDTASVAAFNAQTKTITDKFKVLIMNLKGLPALTTRGMNGMLKAIQDIKDPAVAAMDALGKAMVEPFKTHLQELVAQVNSILTQTGSSTTISFGAPFGGGGTKSAGSGVGDSKTGSGKTPAQLGQAVGGKITGSEQVLREMVPGIGQTAIDMLNQIPGDKTINSVKSDHGMMTASGNISDHYLGKGIDFGLPTIEQMASAGAWIRANASAYGVDASQVFDPGHDPYGGHSGSNAHVHVGFNGPGNGGAAWDGATGGMEELLKLPDFQSGLFSGVLTGLGTITTDALSSMLNSGSGSYSGSDEAGTHGDAKSIAREMMGQFGFGAEQFSSLDKLWTRESNWRWNADNPSSDAYGIPQALPGSKMASAGPDWQTNPATQIKWGLGYIKERYKTPDAAWAHSEAVNWYGNGGSFITDGPGMLMPGVGVGDKQREHVQITPLTGPRAPQNQPSSRSITISPTIVVQGGAGAGDVRAAAQEVADLITREVVEALRSNTEDDI